MKKSTLIVFILAIFLFTSCTSRQDATETNEQVKIENITQVIQGAGEALNAGDLETWTSFFTEDVVVMRPNEFSAVGLKANEERLTDLFNEYVLDINFNIEEVIVSHEYAFVRVNYYETVTPKNGDPPFMIYGKQLNILRKQEDDSWLIARRIHNRNPGPVYLK